MENEIPRNQQDDSRQPYEKPAVVAEEVFETLALSCAKDGGDNACLPPAINS